MTVIPLLGDSPGEEGTRGEDEHPHQEASWSFPPTVISGEGSPGLRGSQGPLNLVIH